MISRSTIFWLSLCILLGDVLLVDSYRQHSIEKNQKQVEEYAVLISDYLWTMNRDALGDLVNIITDGAEHLSMRVSHPDGSVYLSKSVEPTKSFFGFVGLVHEQSALIHVDDKIIDSLYLKSIVVDLGVFFYNFLALAFALISLGYLRSYLHRKSQLEQVSKLAASVFETTSEGIFVLDDEYRISAVNPALSKTTGLSPNDLVGAEVSIFTAADENTSSVATAVAKAYQNGEWQGEILCRRASGEAFPAWISLKKTGVGSGAEKIGLVGLILDISERKRSEIALMSAKEEAEYANRAKSKFLAAASHDLRQPLQALNMFVSALSMSLPAGNDKDSLRRHDIVDKIERSLAALAELLNALLEISKLDAGTMVAEPKVFRLSEVFDWLETTFRNPAEDKNLDFKIVKTSAILRTDQVLFQRALGNLVANAIRYCDKGKILVGVRHRGKNVLIEVYDTGPGIPADKFSEIFVEFRQLDNHARQRQKGLGLGLAVVDRVVKLLGAKVGVRSKLNHGSCFTIEIPKVPCAPGREPEILSSHMSLPMAQGGQRVLIIDDDFAVLQGMGFLLHSCGYQVAMAEGFEQALQACQLNGVPDLIVADYRLQEKLTGAEVMKELHDRLGVNVPGIIVTGDTAPERLREAAESGFTLLHKPVQPEKLKAVVAGLLVSEEGSAASSM